MIEQGEGQQDPFYMRVLPLLQGALDGCEIAVGTEGLTGQETLIERDFPLCGDKFLQLPAFRQRAHSLQRLWGRQWQLFSQLGDFESLLQQIPFAFGNQLVDGKCHFSGLATREWAGCC